MSQTQIANNFDALDGINVGVEVAHTHFVIIEKLGEVLRHTLGESGYQHPVAGLHRRMYFG